MLEASGWSSHIAEIDTAGEPAAAGALSRTESREVLSCSDCRGGRLKALKVCEYSQRMPLEAQRPHVGICLPHLRFALAHAAHALLSNVRSKVIFTGLFIVRKTLSREESHTQFSREVLEESSELFPGGCHKGTGVSRRGGLM